jgi:hypothetical protein
LKLLAAQVSLLGVLLLAMPLGTSPATAQPERPVQEPTLLQQAPSPDARISPAGGVVTVTLVNTTYTTITYQAIGDTEERSLAPRSTVTLQNLKTPTSVTFYRSDRGFLVVRPNVASATLKLTMTASDDIAVDRTFMEIKANGDVYLN